MLRGMIFHKDTGTLETDVGPADWSAAVTDGSKVLLIDGEQVERGEVLLLRQTFRLHPLEVETLARRQKRPRILEYEDHLHLVLHSPILEREEHRILTPELDIIVGTDLLIICRWRAVKCVTTLFERVEKSPEEMMGLGADGLLHALIEELVSNYQPVLDQISGILHGLEERIIRRPSPEQLKELSGIKRELLALRRIAVPQGETILRLSREETPIITEERHVYFRDLYDRIGRVVDMIESYRDITTGARDTYLSVVSNRMNEVMQTLTIIATIMMPLTLIAGIYGMNFDGKDGRSLNMPELRWAYGYPTVMAIMVIIGVIMIILFKRKKWL